MTKDFDSSNVAKLVVTRINFGCPPEHERTLLGFTSDPKNIVIALEQLSNESSSSVLDDGGYSIEYRFQQADGTEMVIESRRQVTIDLER